MTELDLKKAWQDLPDNAKEPVVEKMLMPALLNALGFAPNEWYPQLKTGKGGDAVDFAARHNKNYTESFLENPINPFVLIEIKGRDTNLADGGQYYKTVLQLKKYLHSSATNTLASKWGIITNGDNIQLFRRHGKVIYPYTTNIKLTAENIEEKIALIKYYIETGKRALSVAIYNNKGGVGKTTTVTNLAGILSLPKGRPDNPFGFNKKILVVDFDPNQKDLTDLLGVKQGKLKLSEYFRDYKNNQIQDVISSYTIKANNGREFGFDVIPVDDDLHYGQHEYVKYLYKSFLRKSLAPLKNSYDYILIDSPPGSNQYTEEALLAADVVLMPSAYNGFASFKNAAIAMKTIFPALGELRRSSNFDEKSTQHLGDPAPLPIFLNGVPSKISPTQMKQAQDAIRSIIDQVKKEDNIDLTNFFFPHYTSAQKNLNVFSMPNSAYISAAAFANRPAIFTSKVARDYYRSLAQEYFI